MDQPAIFPFTDYYTVERINESGIVSRGIRSPVIVTLKSLESLAINHFFFKKVS